MISRRQTRASSSFIVTEEPGAISRDARWLAEGQNLEAGALLAENDDGDLVAWESGACAGILLTGTDARGARVRVTTMARMATVNFEMLTFPGEEGDARTALEAIRLTVLSDHLITSPGGGGGGSDWLLSTGAWNDFGVWDDASMWKDAA